MKNVENTLLGNLTFNLLEGKIDDLKKQNPNLHSTIDAYAEHDPTPQKKFVPWLVSQHKKGNITPATPDIPSTLSHFETHKHKLQSKDHSTYSFQSLKDAVAPHIGTASTNAERKKQILHEGLDHIHSSDGIDAFHVKTREASQHMYGGGKGVGKYGTSWCVAARSENCMFESAYGSMYTIHHEGDPNSPYAVHPERTIITSRHNDGDKNYTHVDNAHVVPEKMKPALAKITDHHTQMIRGKIDHIINNMDSESFDSSQFKKSFKHMDKTHVNRVLDKIEEDDNRETPKIPEVKKMRVLNTLTESTLFDKEEDFNNVHDPETVTRTLNAMSKPNRIHTVGSLSEIYRLAKIPGLSTSHFNSMLNIKAEKNGGSVEDRKHIVQRAILHANKHDPNVIPDLMDHPDKGVRGQTITSMLKLGQNVKPEHVSQAISRMDSKVLEGVAGFTEHLNSDHVEQVMQKFMAHPTDDMKNLSYNEGDYDRLEQTHHEPRAIAKNLMHLVVATKSTTKEQLQRMHNYSPVAFSHIYGRHGYERTRKEGKRLVRGKIRDAEVPNVEHQNENEQLHNSILDTLHHHYISDEGYQKYKESKNIKFDDDDKYGKYNDDEMRTSRFYPMADVHRNIFQHLSPNSIDHFMSKDYRHSLHDPTHRVRAGDVEYTKHMLGRELLESGMSVQPRHFDAVLDSARPGDRDEPYRNVLRNFHSSPELVNHVLKRAGGEERYVTAGVLGQFAKGFENNMTHENIHTAIDVALNHPKGEEMDNTMHSMLMTNNERMSNDHLDKLRHAKEKMPYTAELATTLYNTNKQIEAGKKREP